MKMKLGDLGAELNPALVKKAADAATKALPHTVGRLRRLCEDKVMKPIGKSLSELEKQSASANLKRDFKVAAKPNAPVTEQAKDAATQKMTKKTKSIGR